MGHVHGYYSMSNVRGRIALNHHFVKFSSLQYVVAEAAHVRFSIKACRDMVIDHIQHLEVVSVNEHTRFPDDILVDMSYGTISQLMSRLIFALDLGERKGDSRRHEHDQKLQVMKISSCILTDMSKGSHLLTSGIYTRELFEQTFGLVWNVPPVVAADRISS